VAAFVGLFPAVISSLEEISEWADADTSSHSHQLLHPVRETQFIVSLFTLTKIFSYSICLCKALQRKNLDLMEAVSLAEDTKNEIKTLRLNAEKTFEEIFAAVSKCAEQQAITITVPRITSRQTHRNPITELRSSSHFLILSLSSSRRDF